MDKNTRNQLTDIRNSLKEELKKSRYEHTLGVEFTSAALAMRYGEDIFKARLAGLLHDCAKGYSDDKLIELCKKHKLAINDTEKKIPYLLHAKYGAYIAKKDYKIKDKDILTAIEFHSTGRENMSMLEKIVFTADYIEPGRDKAPRLEEIRKIAFEDIDKAMLMIFDDTISYILSSDGEIDEITLKAYNYLREDIETSNRRIRNNE